MPIPKNPTVLHAVKLDTRVWLRRYWYNNDSPTEDYPEVYAICVDELAPILDLVGGPSTAENRCDDEQVQSLWDEILCLSLAVKVAGFDEATGEPKDEKLFNRVLEKYGCTAMTPHSLSELYVARPWMKGRLKDVMRWLRANGQCVIS